MDSEGLRSLLSSACLTFPLDARPLLTLCTSLATASPESAKQVKKRVLRLWNGFGKEIDIVANY